jgi:acetate kinase
LTAGLSIVQREKGLFSRYHDEKHSEAIRIVINLLIDKEYGVIKSMKEIDAVGHRVLHGGSKSMSRF